MRLVAIPQPASVLIYIAQLSIEAFFWLLKFLPPVPSQTTHNFIDNCAYGHASCDDPTAVAYSAIRRSNGKPFQPRRLPCTAAQGIGRCLTRHFLQRGHKVSILDFNQEELIHVSSFRMLQSDRNQEGYASSKSGMIGLTHSMAVLLSEFGIRINLIAPGRVRIAHESKKGDEEGLQLKIEGDDTENFAANRAGMPEDNAECAEWLAGAGFVTGKSITVDGGATM